MTIGIAKELFKRRGCTLLAQEINNVREPLDFICSCGREARISYDKFRSGQLCGGCKGERNAERQRRPIEQVRGVFAAAGCELLSDLYLNNKQKLKYRCSCGQIAEIAYSKFLAGQRCSACKGRKIAAKLTGANNPAWRSELTEEDRVKERTIPGYNEWRRSVFQRDEYRCVSCCVPGGRLNAHHIESYARVPDIRTSVDNGATLCVDCHKEYHRKVSHNDADSASFNYFLTDYREPWYAGERLAE